MTERVTRVRPQPPSLPSPERDYSLHRYSSQKIRNKSGNNLESPQRNRFRVLPDWSGESIRLPYKRAAAAGGGGGGAGKSKRRLGFIRTKTCRMMSSCAWQTSHWTCRRDSNRGEISQNFGAPHQRPQAAAFSTSHPLRDWSAARAVKSMDNESGEALPAPGS